jgi:hypothetical protein
VNEEICSKCKRSVSMGSGRFVDRETLPNGKLLCYECKYGKPRRLPKAGQQTQVKEKGKATKKKKKKDEDEEGGEGDE